MTDRRFQVMVAVETSREYGRGLLRGITRFARERGQWLIERPPYFYQSDAMSMDAFIQRVDRRIDGVIMRDLDVALPRSLRSKPIVYASYRDEQRGDTVRILTDDNLIARVVYHHFVQRGIRHLAFLGYRDMYWSRLRLKALTDLAEQAGLTVCSYELDSAVDIHPARESQALGRWLRSLARPTGLLACNDDCGAYALGVCRRLGLAVGQDLAVVGIDNDEFVCEMVSPPLSSVALNLERGGYQAAEQLHRMMAGQPLTEPTIWVEPLGVQTRPSSDVLATADPVVVEAVRYIHAHLDQGVQVNELQRELAVARRVLYGKFKEHLGCSVHAFIKKARVEKIKQLLRETDLTVSQIAAKMGFPGSDHIAKYFRTVEGQTPTQYRDRHRPVAHKGG